MEKILFKPSSPLRVHENLILIPRLLDSRILEKNNCDIRSSSGLLGGRLIHSSCFSLLTGFFGYPHLLTQLGFIDSPAEKKVYFIGTAGSLSSSRDNPQLLQVRRVFPGGILRHLSSRSCLDMDSTVFNDIDSVDLISVDLVQRETDRWLSEQQEKGLQAVEMEIFPLRSFLKRKFTALVITTDQVTERGIFPFRDRKKIRRLFDDAFSRVCDCCASKH